QQGADDANDGLMRKGDGTLGHGVDIAMDAKVTQVVDEGLLKQRFAIRAFEASQVRQVPVVKTEPLDKVDSVMKAARYRVLTAKGARAENQMKRRLPLRQSLLPVRIGHGELVKVGKQRQRVAVK